MITFSWFLTIFLCVCVRAICFFPLFNVFFFFLFKAVDEPSFSVAYARLCKVLKNKKTKEETVNFKKLLITRCQQEFMKDYMEGLEKDKFEKVSITNI